MVESDEAGDENELMSECLMREEMKQALGTQPQGVMD